MDICNNEKILSFSTINPYHEDIDFNTDFVIVDGLDDTTIERIKSWKAQGKKVCLGVGISWGNYSDYLNGKIDDIEHWDEVQTDKDGNYILHGPNVPYIVPTINFIKYIGNKLYTIIDLGIEAIYFQDPVFWAKGGYSEAFKKEWFTHYKEQWIPPHESVEASYKASKLKLAMVKRSIYILGMVVKEYANYTKKCNLQIYVKHSGFLNCTQSGEISPLALLSDIHVIDGYMANIDINTIFTKNSDSEADSDFIFGSAFLEYNIMLENVRFDNKDVRFSITPSEEQPFFNGEQKKNFERSFVAALLNPNKYFNICSQPISQISKQANKKTTEFMTTLLNCANAVQRMQTFKADDDIYSENSVGVFISDTAMLQRNYSKNDAYKIAYDNEIENLSALFGITIPLITKGINVNTLLVEHVMSNYEILNDYNVLVLSYEFMKTTSQSFHYALNAWIKSGGVLLYVGNDDDSYKNVNEWWKNSRNPYSSPSEHLFEILSLTNKVKNLQKKNKKSSILQRPVLDSIFDVGKGVVAVYLDTPINIVRDEAYAHTFRKMFFTAISRNNIKFLRKNYFVYNRGPYKVIAGLNNNERYRYYKKGLYVDLFDTELSIKKEIDIKNTSYMFLYDLQKKKDDDIGIIAIGATVEDYSAGTNGMSFTAKTPKDATSSCRLFVPFLTCEVKINGDPIKFTRNRESKTIFFKFKSNPKGVNISVSRLNKG